MEKGGLDFWLKRKVRIIERGKKKKSLDERMAKRRGEDIGFPTSYSRRPGF
jgi:hypothetical protein